MKAVVIPVSLNDKPYVKEIPCDHLNFYYSVIGCQCIDLVTLFENEEEEYSIDMYVDDEGLLNESPMNQYFLRAYQQGLCNAPLAGIGVVTKTNSEGYTVDADILEIKSVLKDFGFSDDELVNLK